MSQSIANAVPPDKKKRSKAMVSEWRWGYFFIGPVMLGMMVFSIFPLFYALYMSLTQYDGLTSPVFIGFGNFVQLFQDPQILREFQNTLLYTVGVVPATLIIALVLSNFLNAHIPGKTFFRVVYFLPMVTMAAAVTAVWRFLYHSEVGLVNIVTRIFGWNPQWLGDPRYVMLAIMIIAVWGGIGYASIIMLAGLQGIPRTYYEAAEIDGATPWYQFTHITVPLLTPTIFFLLVTSLINSFKAFDIIFTFNAATVGTTGPLLDAVRTMVYGLYTKGFTLMKMGYAAAEAVLLFALILVVTGIQFLFQDKFVFYE